MPRLQSIRRLDTGLFMTCAKRTRAITVRVLHTAAGLATVVIEACVETRMKT